MSEPTPEIEPVVIPAVAPAVVPLPPAVRWEMATVIALGVVMPTIGAFASVLWPEYKRHGEVQSFALQQFGLLHQQLLTCVVMLYVLYRSGEPWSLWGLRRPRWYDLPLGVAIWLFMWFVGDMVYLRFTDYFDNDWDDTFEFPKFNTGSAIEQCLLIAMSCVNGFAEEVVMRGYLIPRFERLLRSTVAAVVVTSVMFAGYHVYQGRGATVILLVYGLVFGTAFVVLRRLWPLAIAHALADYFSPWLQAVMPEA